MFCDSKTLWAKGGELMDYFAARSRPASYGCGGRPLLLISADFSWHLHAGTRRSSVHVVRGGRRPGAGTRPALAASPSATPPDPAHFHRESPLPSFPKCPYYTHFCRPASALMQVVACNGVESPSRPAWKECAVHATCDVASKRPENPTGRSMLGTDTPFSLAKIGTPAFCALRIDLWRG